MLFHIPLRIVCVFLSAPFCLSFGASAETLETIVLPVRVHRFQSEVEPRLHCTLSDAQIREQFAIANATWKQASIHWEIESIVSVEAKAPKAFTREIDRPNGRLAPALDSNFPRRGLLKGGFNVVFAEDYGKRIGGVFMPNVEGTVFYARKGPKGVQTPAVLAHELGHALGLPHTVFEKDNNLMMGSGKGRIPTPTKPITKSQIQIARAIAKTGSPFSPVRTQAPAQSPNRIFQILDTNGDEVLTIPEVKRNHRLYAVDFFRKASRSPADSLTRKDYDFIIHQQQQQRRTAQGGGRGFGPSIVPQMFDRFDADNDGIITRKEASRPGSLVNEYFDKWDSETDGDGRLTREEVTSRLQAEPAVQGALNKRK